MTKTKTVLQVCISAAALLLLTLHIVFPNVKVDAISLMLVFLALLPWLLPFLKSFELPGGLKIELQDVIAISDKMKDVKVRPQKASAELIKRLKISRFSSADDIELLEALARTEPNLALAGLRLRLEEEIRSVARIEGITDTKAKPLARIIAEFDEKGILPKGSREGMMETVALLNKAVHGARIAPDVAARLVRSIHGHILTIDFDNLHGPC